MRTQSPLAPLPKAPLNPYLVMALAALLPGIGQVINNTPKRGFMMVLYMFILGMVTYSLTTPAHSFAGRYAGALFIYAISVLDAYRWAKYRHVYFQHRHRPAGTA